jgi:large subunit ribosomal protein L21
MAKLAIIRTGGKQYLVKENDKLKIEKLVAEPGAKVEFETLLIADGDQVEMGEPVLETKVSATVGKQGHSRTVIGIKYKRKTREKTKFGHRQKFTEVLIEKI